MIKKDLSTKWCLLTAIALLAVKLILVYGQSVYLYEPVSARIDDTLMLESAISISNGQWLGDYGYLTLSKYMFFPVWLSFVNALGLPYLIAGQLLWALACGACVYALTPVLRQNIWRLALFAFLLYNPAQSAAKVQLRAYRDNIFPALCLLCVAGAIGAAFRYKDSFKKYIFCLIICGAGLAAAYTTREDGVWIAVFALPALLITAIFIFLDKTITKKLLRGVLLFVPACITGAVILTFCFLNYRHYGRFIISDFTSAEFKAAYGAMTRIEHENWHMKVAVPRDVRQKLYDNVPELAVLQPLLESKPVLNAYGVKISEDEADLSTAGFYWALRQIASENGLYETAETAREYWQNVADKINALCDDKTFECGPARSSTLSPMRREYILPIAAQTFSNIGRILVFSEAEPAYDYITIGHGTPELARYEEFLREKSNSSAIENKAEPYYSTKQIIAHFSLALVRAIYAFILPCMFAAALVWLFVYGLKIFKDKNEKNKIFVLTALGLLLSGLVRCVLVAYMFVSSFNDNVEKIMYLSSAHPLFMLFAFLGTYALVQMLVNKKISLKFLQKKSE